MTVLQDSHTLVEVPCPACGHESSRSLAREGDFRIVRCQRCRLAYTSPRYKSPQAHYLGEREAILQKYGAILRGEAGHNRDANYDEELRAIARVRPAGKLLDVGSHCGFFLRRARGLGWSIQGVEPSPNACELAREYYGLEIVQGTLIEADFPSQSFDVVTLVDVFEHIDAPLELLKEVHRIIMPSGVLFIKVPNLVYYLAKYRLAGALGLDTEIFDAKEHVVHYSARTLRRTLTAAGFVVQRAFVPRPIQDGAAWKHALRAGGHAVARLEFAFTRRFGPLAMDLAVLAQPKGSLA
ncbi:MAG: class I SAM-dependent methyltransferase [Chloroflexota bacterium]